jgi:hypothetical protein
MGYTGNTKVGQEAEKENVGKRNRQDEVYLFLVVWYPALV